MNFIEEYYSNYDENGRLLSKHGQVEYLTTMKYIHSMLEQVNGNKILEVGAGTGRYSIALAKEGNIVEALEYTNHNYEILKSNIQGMGNIKACRGNALDLSRYKDDSFDITLVLGPMYHMYTKEDKLKVLSEAIRVTKKGGYIFVAYCMNDACAIQDLFKNGRVLYRLENNQLTDSFQFISDEKEIFDIMRIEAINELNDTFDRIERVKIIVADGATNYMRECIDTMDDAIFEQWLRFHFATCERQDLIGATNHSLDILRKRSDRIELSNEFFAGSIK